MMRSWTRGILAETASVAAAMAICTLIVYLPVFIRILSGDLPGMYDLYRYFVPHAYLLDVAVHEGSPPWWNTLSLCGTPLAANPQAAIFYAPNLLRSLLTSHTTPLNAYFGVLALLGVHIVVAGVGMYYLARRHRLGRPASLVAGLLFIFSLVFVRRALEFHFITAVTWFPFVLVFLHIAWSAREARRRTLYALGAGLCLGMSLFTGFFHITAYMGLLAGGYWLAVRLLRLETPRTNLPRPAQQWFLRDVFTFVILGGVAAGISAVQLIPSWEFLQYTARAAGSKLGEVWMQTGHTLASFLGGMAGYPAENPFLQGLRLSGVVVYVYAVLSFFGSRRREAFAFALLSLALLDCTLGPPFPLASLIAWAAPFKLAYTDRAFIVAAIPLALLGAIGFETASDPVTGPLRYGRPLAIAFTCAPLLAYHGLWVAGGPYLKAAFVCLLLTAAVLAVLSWTRPTPVWAGLLFLLLLIEIVAWNHHFLPRYLETQRLLTRADVPAHPQVYAPGNSRRIEPLPNRQLLRLVPAQNGYDPLFLAPVRTFICRPDQEPLYDRVLAPSYSIPTNNRRSDLLLKRRFWLTRSIEIGPVPPKQVAIQPTTTAYVSSDQEAYVPDALRCPAPKSDETATRLAAKERAANPFREDGAERSWHIPLDRAGVATAPHRILNVEYRSGTPGLMEIHLKDDRFHERTLLSVVSIEETGSGGATFSVSLPEFASSEILLVLRADDFGDTFTLTEVDLLTDQNDENALIAIVSDRFDGVDLEVGPLPDLRMLVFTDTYYPGWSVLLDGAPSHLFRVDDVFKGVAVPPGKHRISFTFRPRSVQIGLAVSSFALLCISGYLIGMGRLRGARRS